MPSPHIWSASAPMASFAIDSAGCRSGSCMSVVPSRDLGIAAPSRVAVTGASARLCIAVIVPFLGIRLVAIPDPRTMAVLLWPSAKPRRPPAYTNISDTIIALYWYSIPSVYATPPGPWVDGIERRGGCVARIRSTTTAPIRIAYEVQHEQGGRGQSALGRLPITARDYRAGCRYLSSS